MKPDVDIIQLAALLADRFRLVTLDLNPIDIACAWPVYKATAAGWGPVFVKVTTREAACRAIEFLESSDCSLLPKPAMDGLPDFAGLSVLCLEWKESVQVNAEDMTDAQLNGFLDGCQELSKAFASFRGHVSPLADEDSPLNQYNALQGYAMRHPVMGRLIRPLLAIPEPERIYGDRPLVTIHGDLQPKNYGFDGDRLAAVYDTDDLTQGLACEDACYAFTERARRSELSAAKRRRLTELFLRLVEQSPWPKDEWVVAVNRSRLRIAARRLEKRPNSVFIAFDIARRDKPLRLLAAALKGVSC